MMKIYIEDIDERTVGRELEQSLEHLPGWRKAIAMNYCFPIDRLQSARAYLLLREALRLEYGNDVKTEFGYGENGKPFLLNYPDIHFNLSHCRKGVMCVVGDKPVGCDIEEIPHCLPEDVLGAAFCEQERMNIKNAANPCSEFARLWTRKESLLKLTGEGLTDNIATLLETEDADMFELYSQVFCSKGYACSVCGEKDLKIEKLKD